MRDLLLDIDRTRKQRSLEAGLRTAIRAGRLKPGDAVPSTRELAADLELARATVVAAYDQLVAEGYLAARQGAPTRVAAGPWTVEHHVSEPSRPDFRLDLIPGEPDSSLFPRAAWLRCTREVLATAPNDLLGYGEPSGLGELRAAIAGYLNRTRNTVATADSTTVVPGAGSGLGQLARLLHRQGATTIAVEEPGFPFHHAILQREGLRLVPVPVNDEGIDIDALAAIACTAVVVTPAHQYPLGTVMSPERRTRLADWARARDAWIVEDDYDGEFRYDRHPVGALQGIAPDRVVYLGTTSKTLGAGLRVGWLVLPPALRTPMAEQRGRTATSPNSPKRHSPGSSLVATWTATCGESAPRTGRAATTCSRRCSQPSTFQTSEASRLACTSPSPCLVTSTRAASSKQRFTTTASPCGAFDSTTRAATL